MKRALALIAAGMLWAVGVIGFKLGELSGDHKAGVRYTVENVARETKVSKWHD